MGEEKYDILIVGAGLFGSVFAQRATENGLKCLIVDKRNHTGGNVYTEEREGINVHVYGPHIFHTSNREIWNYVNRFAEFNNYTSRTKVKFKEDVFSFPINLFTLYQMFGVKTPEEARDLIQSLRVEIKNPKNLEEWALSQVGEKIYKTFIYGYTKKQWGREPKDLPISIIKRIPIRLNFDDNYFDDTYQGIPIGGYTKMIEKMQEGVDVKLGVDFLKEKEKLEKIAETIVYTGPIDEFFGSSQGDLEYRSLKFETEVLDMEDFQGVSLVNYPEEEIPWTRICEHKHFDLKKEGKTVITREYPHPWSKGEEKFYPINDEKNNSRYLIYRKMAESLSPKYIFGGRLAEYKYYDMNQVIASSLTKFKRYLEGRDK